MTICLFLFLWVIVGDKFALLEIPSSWLEYVCFYMSTEMDHNPIVFTLSVCAIMCPCCLLTLLLLSLLTVLPFDLFILLWDKMELSFIPSWITCTHGLKARQMFTESLVFNLTHITSTTINDWSFLCFCVNVYGLLILFLIFCFLLHKKTQ